jgi:hypothetical protein
LGIDPVAGVWCKHPTLIDLRQSLPRNLEGICGNCIFQVKCLGSCVADNFHQHERLTAANWFCQQAERENLFPIGRIANMDLYKKASEK